MILWIRILLASLAGGVGLCVVLLGAYVVFRVVVQGGPLWVLAFLTEFPIGMWLGGLTEYLAASRGHSQSGTARATSIVLVSVTLCVLLALSAWTFRLVLGDTDPGYNKSLGFRFNLPPFIIPAAWALALAVVAIYRPRGS